MKRQFINEGLKRYLVIDVNETSGDGAKFTRKMLLNNQIQGLLSFSERYLDGVIRFYYELDGLQPLGEYFGNRKIPRDEICMIYNQILKILQVIFRYLLKPETILISEETVYLNEEGTVFLCCVPGYEEDTAKKFKDLTEFFMNHMDHKEEDAVVLVYGLFRLTGEENCTAAVIENYMREQQNKKIGVDSSISQRINERQEQIMPEERVSYQNTSIVIPDDCKTQNDCDIQNNSFKQAKPEKKSLKNIQSQSRFGKPTKNSSKNAKKKTKTVRSKKGNRASQQKVIASKGALNWIYYAAFAGIFPLIGLTAYFLIKHSVGNMAGTLVLLIADAYFLGIQKKRIEEQKIDEDMAKTVMLASVPDRPIIKPALEAPFLKPTGSPAEACIFLDKTPLVIGSLAEAVDVVLHDTSVSRIHAVIEKEMDGYYLTDLKSTNLTKLNHRILEPQIPVLLHMGDRIVFGKKEYELTGNESESIV